MNANEDLVRYLAASVIKSPGGEVRLTPEEVGAGVDLKFELTEDGTGDLIIRARTWESCE